MSRLSAPSGRATWLSPSPLPLEVTVLGAGQWYSHWDASIRRTRKCGGLNCLICARGELPVVRYVLLVEYGSAEHLIELRARHWSVLQDVQDVYGTLVGSRLRIYKGSHAPSSPVHVDVCGYVDGVPERDISRLVASLGADALVSGADASYLSAPVQRR